jgi:hypothetical protein
VDLQILSDSEGNWYTTYRVTSDGPGMGSISVVVSWYGALGGYPGIVFDDFGPNSPYFTDKYEPATTVELGPSGALLVADLGAAVLFSSYPWPRRTRSEQPIPKWKGADHRYPTVA